MKPKQIAKILVDMGMGKKLFKKPSKVRTWIARGTAFAIAAYGVYAFGVRQIGEYMLLKRHK